MYLHPMVGFVTIICGFVFLSVASLALYHCQLICVAQTTNENIRQVYGTSENPRDHGCRRNCFETFCGAVPQSYIKS